MSHSTTARVSPEAEKKEEMFSGFSQPFVLWHSTSASHGLTDSGQQKEREPFHKIQSRNEKGRVGLGRNRNITCAMIYRGVGFLLT